MATVPKLNDEQRKRLEPLQNQAERALGELSNMLTEMGTPSPPEEKFAPCLVCGCEGYMPPRHGHFLKCTRAGCGHHFTRHDVR
jgi:hypothetical protein